MGLRLSREAVGYFLASSIPGAAIKLSREVIPNETAYFLRDMGGHALRANLEHGARGFVLPIMGALLVSLFARTSLGPKSESEERELYNIATLGFAALDFLIFAQAEFCSQPNLHNRPIQWDQIGFEVGGLILALAYTRVAHNICNRRQA
jgi:hypothetical protein